MIIFSKIRKPFQHFIRSNQQKTGGLGMFKLETKCSMCGKEIQGNEEVIIKLRFPEKRGMTEIKAFLTHMGLITCLDCDREQT